MRRMRMNKVKSRKIFRRTASRTHRRNVQRAPMRGGIRL